MFSHCWYRDSASNVNCNLNMLGAISMGMQAVKLLSNEINLYLITVVLSNTN